MEEAVCMKCEVKAPRPSVYELSALIAVAYLLSVLLGKLGLFIGAPDISGNISVIAAVTIGLFAGTSSCISVAGGLLLSSASQITTRRTVSFAVGRVLSYAIFGGLIGALGKIFVPSSTLTSILIILASLYMLYAGLDLLQMLPKFLKRRGVSAGLITPPSRMSPFFLGAGTFFIPCGFTQSLQLYALTTGSPISSALILGGFALGTIPALFALGFAAAKAKGSTRHIFFHFAGVVVIILGVMNMNNGLTLMGASPKILIARAFQDSTISTDPNVRLIGSEQVIAMSLGTSPAYSPSDHYTVKAGIPVRMEISGKGEGCRSVFTIPQEHISLPLTEDLNTVTFTPEKKGTLIFSCSMGMYPGIIEVI
jgi:sulfite exporter TauE/SafE